LRIVGAVATAEILEAALAQYSAQPGAAPTTSEEFVEGADEADLWAHDRRFFREGEREVPDALMHYLARHETEFITWVP
jgi:hypothetical protein